MSVPSRKKSEKKYVRPLACVMLVLASIVLLLRAPPTEPSGSFYKVLEQVPVIEPGTAQTSVAPLSELGFFFDSMTAKFKAIQSKRNPAKTVVQAYGVLHHTFYDKCLHLTEKGCDIVAGIGDKHVHGAIVSSFDTPTFNFPEPGLHNDMSKAPQCIDIGSNSGQFTLLMRACGCRVDAYEPQQEMSWFNRGSLLANNWLGPAGPQNQGGVTIYQGGVAKEAGEIKLKKLWRPGGAGGGKALTVRAYPIAEVIQSDVHMLKLDVDGPEAFIIDGLLPILKARTPVIHNIIAEVTVKDFPSFGYDDTKMFAMFDAFYDRGYTAYLVMSEQFPKYDPNVKEKLHFAQNWNYFDALYQVPREQMPSVLTMSVQRDGKTVRLTKNLFFTLDPALSTFL